MTDGSPAVSKAEHRALWIDVFVWPLRGGMLGGVILLVAEAVGLAYLEGGTTDSARETRSYLSGALTVVALLTIGHYAWRAVACTSPAERPVPWGGDDADGSSLFQRMSAFVGVFAMSFLPVFVWVTLHERIGAPVWLYWVVIVLTSMAGAAVFPLGLAGSVCVGSALGALPWRVRRMWKANPAAARTAAMSALVFVGMIVASAILADTFVARPRDIDSLASPSHAEKDPVGPLLLCTLIVLRAGGFYAALASCRVAGLLVREVPEIREVIA